MTVCRRSLSTTDPSELVVLDGAHQYPARTGLRSSVPEHPKSPRHRSTKIIRQCPDLPLVLIKHTHCLLARHGKRKGIVWRLASHRRGA